MEIMPQEVVQSVKNLQKLGEGQYKAFVKERLIDRSKPITEPIKRNNVALFSRPPGKTRSKKQAQVSKLKANCSLFSRIYIACQPREGDLQDFFSHENQPWPPLLSQQGKLRKGNKADLIRCLQGTTEIAAESPLVDAKVFDGAANVTFKDGIDIPRVRGNSLRDISYYAATVSSTPGHCMGYIQREQLEERCKGE